MTYPDEDSMRDADETALRAMFAHPGSRSALRTGSRKFACPTCGRPNTVTAKDVKFGYQCDACADRDEGIGFGDCY